MDDQPYEIPEQALRQQAAADGVTHLVTGAAIVRGGKVLALRREPNDFLGGLFELPGGGIEPGESFFEAVQREVGEEAGLHMQAVTGMFAGFDYATPDKAKARQFNFIVTVADGEPVLSPEHDALQWVDAQSLDALRTSDEMRHCLERALQAVGAR